MLSKLRTRLSYANVMATIAVFVALGGSSYAAIKVTGKNVQDSSLTGADIKNSSLTTSDMRNGSLLAGDFKSGQLPKGDTGAPGLTGANGEPGADGTNATINGVAAGGDLSGTYPAPSIAAGAVTPDDFSGTAFPTARAQSNGNQVVDNNATTFVHLQTDVHRRGVNHDIGTGNAQTCGNPDPTPGDCFLTVTRPGTYLITGSATWASNATGIRQLQLTGWTTGLAAPFVLGSDVRNAVQGSVGQPNPTTPMSVATVRQLTSGQSVSFSALQNSGAGLAVFGTGGDAATLTLTWLGP
ncbi:MAG TPA: hypothetical protein VK486_13885 [Thermoleophilaceae bacterium]|nr:hypothetical protein [Thermoleophilaceae bacterium]